MSLPSAPRRKNRTGIRRLLGLFAVFVAATATLLIGLSPAAGQQAEDPATPLAPEEADAPPADNPVSAIELIEADPEPGAAVAPPEVVTLRFSASVEPTGAGFMLIGPDGQRVDPNAVFSADEGMSWSIELTAPLGDGGHAVNWSVLDDTGNIASGSYGFFVTATIERDPTDTIDDPSTNEGSEAPTEVSDALSVPDDGSVSEPDSTPAGSAPADGAAQSAEADTDTGTPAAQPATTRWLRGFANLALYGALLVGLGIAVFAVRVLSAVGPELRYLQSLCRLAAAVGAGAVVVRIASDVATITGSWMDAVAPQHLGDALGNTNGYGTLLALTALALLVVGTRVDAGPRTSSPATPSHQLQPTAGERQKTPQSVGAAVAASGGTLPSGAPDRLANVPILWAAVAVAMIGTAMMGYSSTVETGLTRYVIWTANAAHLAAAAVWLGGLVAMLAVLAYRREHQMTSRATAMALNFSVDAGVAALGVAVSGIALGWVMVAEPADFVSTTWGRTMLLKIAVAAIAGIIGFVNRSKVVPMLEQHRDHPEVSDELARTARSELIILTVAVMAAALATALV